MRRFVWLAYAHGSLSRRPCDEVLLVKEEVFQFLKKLVQQNIPVKAKVIGVIGVLGRNSRRVILTNRCPDGNST